MDRNSGRILDEYLVMSATAGDRRAWARLVVRWQPRLLRHAWRLLGNVERAKDVVQESWLEILRGLTRLDDVVAFPAWAFRIVTRRCQRLFRGTERDRRLAEELTLDAEPQVAFQEDGAMAADADQVRAAMQALPAPQRACLALFYLEDLSVAEIAVALDVPPGTVKTRLMHARRKVRAQLMTQGEHHEQV
jgi:RNA polymerase sigma factor (sigma-70 family)